MSKFQFIWNTALVLIAMPGIANSQAGPCSEALCIQKRVKIDATCHGVGGLVYFEDSPTTMCYCKCSCLNASVAVETTKNNYRAISELKIGDTVLVLNEKDQWIEEKTTYSEGSTEFREKIYYAIFIKLEDGTEMVATPDHLFLSENRTLVRADRLQSNTKLVGADLKLKTVDKIYAGSYEGPFHNIAVGILDNNVKTDKHLINTGGVISGDFYLQTTSAERLKEQNKLPQVGSQEYIKQNFVDGGLTAFASVPESLEISTKSGKFKFVPYKPIPVPKDALHFLPDGKDEAKPGTLVPLDSSVPYEVADYLVMNYKAKFPDIQYHIDWTNSNVNAQAYMIGAEKHIVLFGGLLRHRAIQVEGAGLVLAHEIGHHHGGTPRYPAPSSWASCEGQADYWAAVVGERRVWWGPYAIEQIEKGSQQLYQLFQFGLMSNPFNEQTVAAAGICSHPPAYCRFQTYQAGKTLSDKPACAGDPGPFGVMSTPMSLVPN